MRPGQVFNDGQTDASISQTGLSPSESILDNDRRRLIPPQMTDPHARLLSNARQRLSARYLTALRAHLGGKHPQPSDRAQGLGRATLAGGLATLDLAIIHEQAIVALAPSFDFAHPHNGALKRAGDFFTQALIPLEAAQRATRQTNSHLRQRNATLRLHTAALAKGNRRLEREIARRKAGETVIRQGREHYQKLFLESQFMQRKLRHLTRQILTAQEEERKKISRELHDEVVQTLVGINVELAALGQGTPADQPALKTRIARTQRLVENSVAAVHRFARELRPAVLDDLGLIPALHAYSKRVAARAKLKIKLTAFSGLEALDSSLRTVLFRVAQEALTNVARHARASAVTVCITEIPGAVRLKVQDNGQSFQVAPALSAKTNRRLGLLGMRERVEMVGGLLLIESAPGRGTAVCAEIPFEPEKPL